MRLPRLNGTAVGNCPSLNKKWWTTTEYLILFAVLAGVVLFSIPPWRSYFFTGLGEHWDTQLMGQWMAWNAHNILHGKFLLPDFNANYYYPHSLTLAFGEMLWPESFIYAVLFLGSKNPFFAFNGTMLFFWALAGVCMYTFLRELRITRVVGYLGSFIYCLMPLLLMYYIEFNMVLIFIIPLMLFLLIRWMKNPTAGYAFLFCCGCFISVTSCIYYTYMVAFPLFFMFIAYAVNNRALLHNKNFYWTLGLIGLFVILIAVVYLNPYVMLKQHGGYERSMNDFMISHAQPLAYLDTRSSALFTHLFTPEKRWQETYLFPGSVLAVLALLYFISQPAFVLTGTGKRKGFVAGLVVAAIVLWLAFWLIVLTSIDSRGLPGLTRFAPWLYPISIALLILYTFKLFLRQEGTVETMLVSGLAAGAVVCFFISLGPFITIGQDARLIKMAHGPFFQLFEQTDVFSVVRGLTRFAVVVMVYLITGSCVMLQRLLAFKKQLIWFFPLVLFFLVFEAGFMKYRYTDYGNLVNSPVIQSIKDLPEKSVLFQIPTTPKVVNAHSVLNTIGDFPLLVNGYSGFVPESFGQIDRLLKDWNITEVTTKMREIWPSVYLLVDRPSIKWLATGWKKPFPWSTLDSSWELINQDTDYSLYRLKKQVFTAERLVRRVRTDVLQANSVLHFKAQVSGDADRRNTAFFRILLNGQEVARDKLAASRREYSVALPEKWMGNLTGDRVVLDFLPTAQSSMGQSGRLHWQVGDVTFTAAGGPNKTDSHQE